MRFESISHRQLPYTDLFRDYADSHHGTGPFFACRHRYEDLRKTVLSFKYDGDRDMLTRLLHSYHIDCGVGESNRTGLQALAGEEAVTITTGQQLGFYGGPLFAVYKILSTIYLSDKLTRDTGRKVIPVFWLADEDHDYEEIAEVLLPRNKKMERIRHAGSGNIGHAAGHIILGESFRDFRRKVHEMLPQTDFKNELFDLLDSCYEPGKSIRTAFAQLVSSLFSHHGLIVAGSNHAGIKRHVSACIRQAISDRAEIQRLLEEQSGKIAKDYHQQVTITDSLLFWHDPKEGRVRLDCQDGIWERAPGIRFSTSGLVNLAEENPAAFSPNVFLRPVIQDTLLPNIAYVGGPAEVAYHAQMKPLYGHFGMNAPFLACRLTATLMEPSVGRYLKDLPFEFPDYAMRREDLESQYVRSLEDASVENRFSEWKSRVDQLTEEMLQKLDIRDPGLLKAASAATKEHCKSIERLENKWKKSIKQKEEVQIKRIGRIKDSLFPMDMLQERAVSFIYYMNKYGTGIWTEMLESLKKENPPLFTDHWLVEL